MERFDGRVAVVTGGGSGMGRQLVLKLTAEGCDVAFCDILPENLTETVRLASGHKGRLLTLVADVANESQVLQFRDAVQAWRPVVHLLFNNAGISGGGSFVKDSRESWERTFNTCFFGVYYSCRAFMDLLLAAERAQIVNTSSVCGFYASLGPDSPQTAYCAAKFAVKGFTEALITDLRLHAPHISVALVMPGHVGTDIIQNSNLIQGTAPEEAQQKDFHEKAPTSAAEAADTILKATRTGEWRVLVGPDAKQLDLAVRRCPERAYDRAFLANLNAPKKRQRPRKNSAENL